MNIHAPHNAAFLSTEDVSASSPLLFKVTGYSMYPGLREGDRVVLERCSLENLCVGNLAVYRDKDTGALICHRVVLMQTHKKGLVFFARGDASFSISGPIDQEQVLGKVVALITGTRLVSLSGRLTRIKHYIIAKLCPAVYCLRLGVRKVLLAIRGGSLVLQKPDGATNKLISVVPVTDCQEEDI